MAKKTNLPTLINYTNLPYQAWSDVQKEKAKALYTAVIDKALPQMAPDMAIQDMYLLLGEEFEALMQLYKQHAPKQHLSCHVLLNGDPVFVYNMVDALHSESVQCYTPVMNDKQFVQFRPYADYDALSAQNQAEENEMQNVMNDLQDTLKEFEQLYKPKK